MDWRQIGFKSVAIWRMLRYKSGDSTRWWFSSSKSFQFSFSDLPSGLGAISLSILWWSFSSQLTKKFEAIWRLFWPRTNEANLLKKWRPFCRIEDRLNWQSISDQFGLNVQAVPAATKANVCLELKYTSPILYCVIFSTKWRSFRPKIEEHLATNLRPFWPKIELKYRGKDSANSGGEKQFDEGGVFRPGNVEPFCYIVHQLKRVCHKWNWSFEFYQLKSCI